MRSYGLRLGDDEGFWSSSGVRAFCCLPSSGRKVRVSAPRDDDNNNDDLGEKKKHYYLYYLRIYVGADCSSLWFFFFFKSITIRPYSEYASQLEAFCYCSPLLVSRKFRDLSRENGEPSRENNNDHKKKMRFDKYLSNL